MFKKSTTSAAEQLVEMNLGGGALPMASTHSARTSIMRMPLSRIAAYLLVAVAMAFTMVGLLPQSVRAEEASGDEGISTYALSDHTVQGVSPNGTTINVFDYWIDGQNERDDVSQALLDRYGRYNERYTQGINAGRTLKFGAGMGQTPADAPLNEYSANYWTQNAQPRTGIVDDQLGDDGYPVLSGTLGSDTLSYLFNGQEFDGKAAYMDIDGLLQVDSEGYYYYNSQENFAEFDEKSNSFTLYDAAGVDAGGSSPAGQFFPFDAGSEVFVERDGQLDATQIWDETLNNYRGGYRNIKSTDSVINHYFGLSMSTRFVQQYGGHTAETGGREVTYNFSGDDDVWIFIDDVLVADLGGIHDKTSVEINFSTGRVIVYDDTNNNNKYDFNRDIVYSNKTLEEIFDEAHVSGRFSGDTFADNTFHTLDFFYLERGNTDSNMSLKYNLVTIPETDIQKIDQVGEPIANVTFNVSMGGQLVCTATTDENGNVVLLDGNDFPITLNNLFTQYAGKDDSSIYLTFTETNTPVGYRSAGTFTMRLTEYGDSVLLLSDDKWETGAYALSKVTTTATNEITYTDGRGGVHTIPTSTLQDEDGGNLFVIVEKYADTNDDGTPDTWCPVYGDPLSGWTVLGDGSIENVITAARETGAVFQLASSGNYEATIDGLPGDVLDYVFFAGEGDGSLRGVYYYTTANRWEDVDAGNTYVVTNSDELDRVFSARLLIPNTVNRFIVQKVDETGTPVNGATMALYTSEQVTVDENGVAIPKNEGDDPVEPYKTVETRTLTKDGGDQIDLEGGAIFTKLEAGTYWVGELNPLTGYVHNDTLTKVIVENEGEHPGVYADAGEANDGVTVLRGVGRIVRSMVQFATDDDIDLTLHEIVATPMVGEEVGTWDKLEGADDLHLEYSTDTDTVLDYKPSSGYTERFIEVDEGIPYLQVKQCKEHREEPSQDIKDTDVTNLYTGVTIVRIANVHEGDFELSKTVDPTTVTDSFAFDFEFEQQLPADNEETGEVALSTATANYIKTLFPGNYEYTITKSGVTDPVEQGTLTIGKATASGGDPGGDTSGEGGTEASAKYIITNVIDVKLSGGAESHFTASAESGFYQVKLAHGETLTINGLPVYTQITATEVKPAGSYLTTVVATPEVTVTEVTAADVEADVDVESEGNSAIDGTETETAVDGEDTADGSDTDNTGVATVEELALDGEESAVADGEQTTDVGEDDGADVSNETVAPQASATSVYTATTIIKKQVTGGGADAPVSYNASIEFKNTQSANATINVQKTLVGTDWTTGKNAYEFTIAASEETPNAPLPDPAKITIDAKSDDSFDEGSETEPVGPSATVRVGSFGEIAFTGVDENSEFVYEISETNPTGEGSGWTYDGHTVKVTVTFEQDETTHELEAVVTYDNTAAATDDDKSVTDAAAFTNIYELTPAETESNLTGTKTLNRDFQQDDSFTFDVSAAYAAPENSSYSIEAGQIPLPEYVTRTNDSDGNRTDAGTIMVDYAGLSGEEPNVDFGAITFELPGIYTYTISEQVPDGATNTELVDAEGNPVLGADGNPITYGEANPEQQAMAGWTLNGVTYDGTSYTVTYTVTDDGDGTMTVAGPVYGIVGAEADDPAPESLAWKNTYEASGETEAELDFAKVLVGKDWATDGSETTDVNEADSFTFTLTPLGGTTNTTFVPGEDFDPENLPEGFNIAAENVPMPEGEDGTSVPVTEVTVSAATGTVNVDGATYDAADFSFGPIAYAAAGKYYYQVTEKVPQQDADPYNGAMTYSTKTVVVEVTVTDNLKGGFTASVAYLGEAEGTVRPQFTNMYGTELDYGTEGGLNIEKSLDGRDIKSGEFQFVVTAQDSATADKFGIENSGTEAAPVYTKTVTLNTDQPVDVATGIATATLEDVLGSATFTQNDAGVTTYTLTVHEVKGGSTQDGVAYDDVTYTLTITTADDGRGHLTVTTVVKSDEPDAKPVTYDYTNGEDQNNPVTLEFSNAYDASTTSEGALGIEGAKTLTNANIAGYEGKFTFALSYVYSNENGEQVTAPVLGGDNGTTPVKTTNDDEGNFAFPAMAYTTDQLWSDVKSGIAKYDAATDTFTYTYRVSEDTSDLPEGVTGVSGATSFDVTVTVADNGNGTLKATPAYPQSGSTIKNAYGTGAEDQVVLSGTKVLSSQEGDNPPSIAGQYTFTLTAPEGTPLPQGEGGQTVTTASNDASGSVLFGTITYTMEDLNGATLIDTDGHRYKDFTYTVTESGSVTGVTNDAQPTRTVTVRVTDNGNGTLSAKIVDGNGTEVQGSSFTFTNTYTAVEVTLEATKRVVGAASVEPFTFTLTQMPEEGALNNVYVLQNGELVAFESETATTVESIADGETDTVSFGELVFTAAGTYTFQVVENEAAGTAPDHWTYDKSVKTITVNVAADEGGKLTATTIVDGQETNDPTFINTYYNGEEAKTVHNPTTDPEVNIDGQLVGVGSVLEYRIDWVNNAVDEESGAPTSANVVIEDTIPAGTELVEGSIRPAASEEDGITVDDSTETNGTITWTLANRAPGDRGTVSFKVLVTEDAIEGFEGEGAPALTNQATVTAGNEYETNITSNPLPEKTSSNDTADDGVKLGDTLTFTITYTNGEDEPATVTVSDTLSSGLTYEADSWTITDSEGNRVEDVVFEQNGQTLTWTISDVAAGASGTVSFKASVNENAVTGTDPITNEATVKVGDNPAVDTNTTTDEVEKGELSITKVVASDIADATYDTNKTFTFTVTLTKDDQPLTGPYTYSVNGGKSQPLTLDNNGTAQIKLSDDQTATIERLPVGAHYEVTEADYSGDGFTTRVTDGSSTGDIAANNAVTFTNTYGASGELSGNTALTVTKSIVNRDWQDGDSFEFTLSAGDDATEAAVDSGDVVLPSGANSNPVTVTNTAGHTAAFGSITFNQTGTYTFAITETVPDAAVNPAVEGGTVAYGDATDEQKAQPGWTLNGLTYDNQLHTVTVTVKDNGNGKLTATPAEGTADLAVEIANGYEASGSLSLAATKQLENDEIAEYDGAFKFTVSVSKADGTSKTVSLGTNDETGSIAFGAIKYTIEDLEDDVTDGYAQRGTDDDGNRTYTYIYTVAEDTSGLPDGVTAVVASHRVIVVVTDDGNGNLTAAVTDPVGYDGGKGLVFENTYGASGKAEITVGGTKTYATAGTTNAPDIAGKYTFTLTGADGAPMPEGAVDGKLEVTNATGGASETISFGTITYTMSDLDGATDTDKDGKRDRTFTYTVTESGTVEGVVNDSDAATGKTFTVTLVDNGDGTITATCSETTNAQFAFTNTYRVDPVTTKAPLEGTKAMDGRAFQTGDTFTFTIEGERKSDGAAAPLPSKATPTGEGATTGTVTITPTSGYEADIDFGTIKFTEPGTYIYTVSESDFDAAAKEAMPNVEKDPTVFTVTYVVTDEGDGTMSVGEPTYAVAGAAEGSEAPTGLAWTNTYTAEMDYDAAGGVWFEKTLTGYNFGAGKFSFTVTASDADSQAKLAELAEGDLNLSSPALTDGVAASWQGISGLTFDQDDAGKTFTFVVAEIVPDDAVQNDDGTYTFAGITYDNSPVTVEIEVFDNGDGTMHTVTMVTKGNVPKEFDSRDYDATNASTRPTVSFTNSYEAADATVSSLTVRKAVEGAANSEDFTFTATFNADASAAHAEQVEGGVAGIAANVSPKTLTATVSEDFTAEQLGVANAKTASLSTVNFTEPGIYVFDVKETNTATGLGWTYDKDIEQIVVTVTDDGTGQLTASTVFANEGDTNSPLFVNSYATLPTTVDGETELAGTKTLTGRDALAGETFTFELVPDKATDEAIEAGDLKLGATTAEVSGLEDGEPAGFHFGDIIVNAAGTYTFTVRETGHNDEPLPSDDGVNGMTYDRHAGTVQIVATETTTGQFDIDVTAGEGENDLSFENSYTPAPVSFGIDEAFGGTKTVADDSGHFEFKADQFTFILRAQNANNPLPSGDGITPLPSEDGLPGVSVTNGVPDASGVASFDFGSIEFTEPGTYIYNIFEDTGDMPDGVSGDNTQYTLTITVSENEATGELYIADGGVVAVKVVQGTGEGSQNIPVDTGEFDFTNTYDAGQTAYNQPILKNLVGRDFLAKDSFVFEVDATATDLEGNPMSFDEIPLPDGATTGGTMSQIAENKTGDGYSYTITINPFGSELPDSYCLYTGNVTYTHEGVYTYKVREVSGDDPNITYSDAAYTVTVTIEVNDENPDEPVLTRSIAIDGAPLTTGNTIDFTNIYTTTGTLESDGEFAIKAAKAISGREWLDSDSFMVTLTARGGVVDGSPIAAAQVPMPLDENGEVADTLVLTKASPSDAFEDIVYTQPGTYTYRLTEVGRGTTSAGITYSRAVYDVVVTAVDNNGDGTMTVTSAMTCVMDDAGTTLNPGVAVDDRTALFTNTYDSSMDYDDEAGGVWFSKTLTGHDLAVGQFSFTVGTAEGDVASAEKLAEATTQLTNPEGAEDGVATSWSALSGLTFDEGDAGTTFTFTVAETNGGVPGYAYDAETATVEIQVVDEGDGTMYTLTTVTKGDASTTYDSRTFDADDPGTYPTVAFANSYEDVTLTGDTALGVRKAVVGHDTAVDFAFTATFNDGASTGSAAAIEGLDANGALTTTIAGDFADGDTKDADFGAVTFKEPGVYVFDVVEDNAAGTVPAGWYYDENTYKITVTVEEGDGTGLTATTEVDGVDTNNPTFTNTYSVTPTTLPGATNLRVTKELEGRDWLGDVDSYTFTLKLTSGNDSQVTMPDPSVVIIDANMPDHEAAFGDITFAAADTYTFTVTESAAVPGVTNDPQSVRTVTVDVVDNNDGTLTPSVTSVTAPNADGETVDSDLTFTNTYDPADATLEGEGAIKVQKTLTGRAWAEGEAYSFTIAPAEGYEDAPMPENATVTVGAPTEGPVNTAAFGTMTFSQAGTYVYEISENVPGEGDEGYRAMMAYDAHVATVTVAVTEDQAAGTLTAHVIYDNSAAPSVDDQYVTGAAAFTNTQNLKCELPLSGTKTLEGRNFQDGDSFTFTVSADPGAPLPNGLVLNEAGPDATEVSGSVTVNPTEGTSAAVNFGTITFTQAGEYIYHIAEQAGSASGMTYDTTERVVIVTVTDDGQGNLTSAITVGADQLAWTNTYAPVFDGATTVNLNGTKVLEGSTLTAGQFYFKVTPLDGAPMGDTWEFGNTNGLGANGALENVGDIELLRNITYTVADMGDATEKTFRYVVTEEIPSEGDRMPGLAYDGSAYLASVTVTDDLAGNLVASAPSIERGVWDGTTFTADEDQAGVEGVVFTNGYTVSGTTAAPVQVTKVLAGNRTAPLAAGEFEFELSIVSADPADGLTLPEETTASNAADGTVSFGEVSFSKPGTYVLSVAEVVPEGAEQNGDGSYTLDGVTYDTHAVTMTYTVVDQNAQLVATLGAVEGDTTFTNTYNATETLDGAVNLTVTKAVEGDFTWKEGTSFTFALTGADIATQEAIANGTVVLPDNADGIAIAYNAADPDAPHTASFGDITFKAAGDYLFAITEQQGDIAGMTYDVEQHLVSVAVTDNGDGTLAVVPDADTVNPTITNTYEPTEAVLSGAGNLTVTKNLVGRDWQEGDSFTFVLEADMDDETTADAMNDGAIRLPGNAGGITVAFDANDPEAAHSASFGDIAFTRAGTYRFTVTELAGSIDGVVYDTAAHEVVVTVVDNGDGTLGFAADGVVGANPTVTNVFTAPIDYSARSEIVISKTLDGRPATDGQFSFTVTPADEASALKLGIPEDGYTLSTPAAGDGEKASVGLFATLAADGIAPLAFTSDDAGTTFSYTVTENGTAPAGYTYDASVYTVDITVTDDPSAGGLTVTTQASDGAGYTMMTTVTNATEFAQPVEIPFVNSYRASTDVEGGAAAVVNGTKELVGTAMREFSFVLEGVAGTNTEGYTNTAVNDENGSFSFTLDYDQDSFTAGATANENGNRSEDFVYTLHEVGAGEVKGGITYDDARYRATVTVADNGDGTMAASVTKLEQLVVDEAGTESWIPADAAAFTNTYAAATSVSLDVDKVLSGRDMTAADSYEFVAYAYDRATQTIDRTGLVATGSTPAGQTAADGTPVQVAMSSIEYTIEKLNADTATPWVDVTDEAGQPTGARTKTYDYAIEEVVGSDLNVSYAPEVFYAQVVVTDDGQGNLTATKAYFADAAMQQQLTGEDGSSTVPTFVNTYLPDATSFHLTGTKITTFVNVDPGTEPELRFMYDIYLEENGTSELVASGWSYANGTVSADIPVTGEGSFTYRIVECYAGTTSGTVTYDDAVYYLTLEVARNADTGIYDFAPTYYRVEDDGTWTQIDAADLTFENTYDGAAGTTVSLGATKVLEGATFEQLGQLNDKFGFSLYEGDEYTGTKLGEGTITGVDANGNGIVTFPNLTYTFYLQDQPAAETPDEGEQTEGGETAETPEEGTEAGQPDGSEEGTEGEAPEGGQTGTGETGTTVPSDPNAGQPSGEGGATEPDQPAEPSGDAGAAEPVTPAEPDQPAADVPAETPAVEGTPEVAPEAPAEDASGDAGVQAASIADLFVASEAIADDADAEPFTVDIVDTGAQVVEVADGAAGGVAESAADGQAGTSGETAPAAPAEPVIVSDDLGTHVYTIVENVPAGSTQNEDGTWTAPNGVTYDGTKYRVTVEVAASYDAATQKATMTATVTGIARSDSHGSFEDGHATPVDPTNPAASIVFTNSYTARQPVEVSFAGTKNLTGRDMAEGEFSFAVLEGETPVATATNAANGTVSFSFGVTTPGTHTYTVVEADGGKGGVDYDTAPRTVVVEVGVNPDGTLAVESVAPPEGGLVFNNTYTASGSTEAVIEGTKALTGRTMAEGEFRFVVVETVDGVENIVAAGENQAPGEDGVAAITFAPIAYDTEDLGETFTYQVRELDLGAGGVTYDTAAFTVQVAVVDDLDGTISTEVTYLDGPVVFENSYGTVDGAKVEVTPEATKTLTGRDMVDGEFVFTVTDAVTGNVVATGANTADGKVVWDAPITLTAKGDYEFVIAEVNGRQDGVTYDDATYRLLVTVADDGEGGLTVESLDYPDGTPAFANSYEEPEKPADPDKPSIPGGPTESVPQTGDDTNLAAAAALGLGGLGAALLGGGALLRRRAGR